MTEIITASDFVNRFEIATSVSETAKISTYITRYQPTYLRKCLGVELYDLFDAGVEDEDPIYEALLNPFAYQRNDGQIVESRGIADALLGIIYFYYSRDKGVQATINGGVKMKNTLSDRASVLRKGLYDRYNEGITTLKSVQQYCLDNSDVYPEFNGVELDYAFLEY
jgi:hypothetical protein